MRSTFPQTYLNSHPLTFLLHRPILFLYLLPPLKLLLHFSSSGFISCTLLGLLRPIFLLFLLLSALVFLHFFAVSFAFPHFFSLPDFSFSFDHGKSTVIETFMALMGGYGKAAGADTFSLRQRWDSAAPSEDLAKLAGARAVNVSEPDRGMVLNAPPG